MSDQRNSPESVAQAWIDSQRDPGAMVWEPSAYALAYLIRDERERAAGIVDGDTCAGKCEHPLCVAMMKYAEWVRAGESPK